MSNAAEGIPVPGSRSAELFERACAARDLRVAHLGDEASAVLLMIWLTVWATTDEVLVVSPASPL